MSRVREINDWLLPEVLVGTGGPVFVLFTSTELEDRREIARAFHTVAHEHAGTVHFLILDVDENPSAAAAYALKDLPTAILYSKGTELSRRGGPLTYKALTGMLVGKSQRS